jgi:putative transposase
MARLPRLVVPNQPHHLIQHGIEGQPAFRDADDYLAFLAWLREAARQFRVAIHAYVLMPGHVHLLATPADEVGLGRMMQWIGRHYVPYFNQKYGRAGTLWQGRYKATVVDAEHYLMACSVYMETNPIRAGLAPSAEDYPWSSYRHHVGASPAPLIADHPLYWALGNTPFDREAAYKNLVEQGVSADTIVEITDATRKGWALGSDKFKEQLQKAGSRRVQPTKRGRPRKKPPAVEE